MSRYIEFEIARKYLHEACAGLGSNGGLMLKIKFDEEPTADVVEVVHGKWIKTTIAEQCGTDELHRTMYRDRETVKCSDCGARMDGEKMNKHEQIILLLIGWLESEHLGMKDEAIKYIKDVFDIDVTKWENYEEYIRKASEGE